MSWADAIKAALISIPKLIDIGTMLIERLGELILEVRAGREFNQQWKEYENAKEQATRQNNTQELNRLFGAPPRIKK
jgi:hypothetical protein